MRYLVELTYKNGQTPIYQYYNTVEDIYQIILQNNNIEFIEVYTLDKEKTKIASKLLRKDDK